MPLQDPTLWGRPYGKAKVLPDQGQSLGLRLQGIVQLDLLPGHHRGGGRLDGLKDQVIPPQLELILGEGHIGDVVDLVLHQQVLVAQPQGDICGYLAHLVAKVQFFDAQDLGYAVIRQLLQAVDIYLQLKYR